MKISLPNFDGMVSDHKNQQKKSLVGVALCSPSYFPALMNLAIFAIFHNTDPRIELTKTLLFILKVLWCSNNLMQKMTSTNHSIYEIVHLQVFFKNFAQKFPPFLCLLYTVIPNVWAIRAIPSIYIQRSLIYYSQCSKAYGVNVAIW